VGLSERGIGDDEASASGEEAPAGRTILLVEDENGIRLALVRALSRHGYDAIGAANGAEAMRLLAERPDIDLIVTDLTMPQMTGEQLAQRVEVERPGLPVVLMSGYSPSLVESGAGVRGGHHFLQKPFAIELFLRTVADALAGVPAGER
jgi:two-component system cell cycle sensor histidine kinase/response regulator CckA